MAATPKVKTKILTRTKQGNKTEVQMRQKNQVKTG